MARDPQVFLPIRKRVGVAVLGQRQFCLPELRIQGWERFRSRQPSKYATLPRQRVGGKVDDTGEGARDADDQDDDDRHTATAPRAYEAARREFR